LVKPYNGGAQVTVSDSLVLLDIATSFPNVYQQWNKTYPISTWPGVNLSADGTRVTLLDLSIMTNGTHLQGVLPASIGNLDSLIYLSVESANFTDSAIPASIGNLEHLITLDLEYSNVSSLPPAIGNFSNLFYLHIGSTHIKNLPVEIGNLSSLSYLDLSNSLIKTLPAEIGNLSSLTGLTLSHSLIETLPAEIGNLSKLASLDLSYSHLQTLPTEIGNLSKLASLNLVFSKITTLPPGIGNLHAIQYLDLSNIPLTEIPPELGNMSGLTGLNITYDNALDGNLPSTIGNLTNLQTLTISNTTLKGRIPGTLGNLTHLKRLVLSGNAWTGNLEPGLGNLDSLSCLHISEKSLKGNIPPELGNLKNLDSLFFYCDSITGGIPGELGNLASLRYIDMSGAKISGALPAQLGNLSNLTYLQIHNTKINGKIPATFGNLSNLYFLYLRYNQLDDSLQPALGQLHNLKDFDLGFNKIPGSIPPEFGNIGFNVWHTHDTYGQPNTTFFSLAHNELTGTIPPELGNLYVSAIDLSYNQLTGPIPPKFDSLNGAYAYTDPYVILNNNKFNFAGYAACFNAYPNTYYDIDGNITGIQLHFFPQASLPIVRTGNTLKVLAGDSSKNLYCQWSKTTTDYTDTIAISTPGPYWVSVQEVFPKNLYPVGQSAPLYSDTIYITSDTLIMPARPSTLTASYEYTDTTGWTHYCYDNNTPNDITDDTLLLSLKKNGHYIGVIGDGHFSVKLIATPGAGSNTGIKLTSPLITNSSGYYVMNRYWQVTPTHEPAASVGVRFYYNNQDLADVNGSYPTHNLTNDKLIFYKAVGGNPDPTTNLAGATKIISIMPAVYASDTTWTYHRLSDSTQYGEYSVASFSGGGGGGTGNNFSLPVTLLNFTAARAKTDVNLNWQTAQEINAANYFVERSQNGFDFTGIGTVAAMGNSTVKQSYSDVDRNAAALNTGTLYYRLKITDKDGSFSYSKIVSLQPDGIDKALILYPNPAHTSAIVQFTAATAKKYTIAVTAADGKVLRRINIAASAGSNRVVIDVHDLPQATYLVNITGNKDSKTLTLVKQ